MDFKPRYWIYIELAKPTGYKNKTTLWTTHTIHIHNILLTPLLIQILYCAGYINYEYISVGAEYSVVFYYYYLKCIKFVCICMVESFSFLCISNILPVGVAATKRTLKDIVSISCASILGTMSLYIELASKWRGASTTLHMICNKTPSEN